MFKDRFDSVASERVHGSPAQPDGLGTIACPSLGDVGLQRCRSCLPPMEFTAAVQHGRQVQFSHQEVDFVQKFTVRHLINCIF